MKIKKYNWIVALVLSGTLTSCFDLTEETFDRVDASVYYEDENSIKGSVATIYAEAAYNFEENLFYLQEFSADQVAWRSWNGGLWGYDEGEKFVLSSQTWTPESKIIKTTWSSSWTCIGLCNSLINDLSSLNPTSLDMTQSQMNQYIAEVRTMRAWAYYNIFEIWGGALPLNTSSSNADVPPTADPDFDTSCKKIYDFICTELDESVADLPKNNVNRMNQAVNRILKARMLFNAEVFIKENHYAECAAVCEQLKAGDFGSYQLASDYRDIYSINNTDCPEVIFAFSEENGQLNTGWMRDMPYLPYNYNEYFDFSCNQSGWNCVCLAPSYDNSGTVNTQGGSTGATCFLDAPYNDKLGAVYERFDDRDIRKQNYSYNSVTNTYSGIFLKGAMKANHGTGNALTADADRDGQSLVYVDQVGTFQNKGRNLEKVMSPRWGETNSGVRLVRYPIYPSSAGIDFQDIDEVEFRFAEVYYMLAECKLRAGDANTAKSLVNDVRKRYFSASDWNAVKDDPGRGFTAFDEDWMLSQWGIEFLNEGRRRRTDLRRFDKFTQGQWWFFGRTVDDGYDLPAKRDRKYEWYPLPASALMVNPGLVQNPNY